MIFHTWLHEETRVWGIHLSESSLSNVFVGNGGREIWVGPMRGAQGTWKKKKKIGEEERGRPFFPPMSSSQTCTMQTLHRFWLSLLTADTRLPLVPKWSSNEMPSLFVASFWNDRTILTECPRHTVDKALKAGLNWNERKFFKGLRYRGLWSLDCVCSWIFLFYCRVTWSKMNLHLTYYWSAWV